jgi:hypothetical protein
MSPGGQHRSVTLLYKDFEAAWATLQAIPSTDEKHFDQASNKCAAIADRIVRADARSIDEMLIKIRVALWDAGVGSKTLAELDQWNASGIHPVVGAARLDCLVSLRNDLLTLAEELDASIDRNTSGAVASDKSSSRRGRR